MSTSVDALLQKVFAGRRRFQLAWLFAVVVVLTAEQYPSIGGVLICFAGATLRFVSNGFLRKSTVLAVGGPYAYTRNPLYLGTLLMLIGATLSVGQYALTLVMGVALFVNYLVVIRLEERNLRQHFDATYLEYCELVPRLLPRIVAPPRASLEALNPDPESYSFSYELAKKNRAMQAYFSFFALVAAAFLAVWGRSL